MYDGLRVVFFSNTQFKSCVQHFEPTHNLGFFFDYSQTTPTARVPLSKVNILLSGNSKVNILLSGNSKVNILLSGNNRVNILLAGNSKVNILFSGNNKVNMLLSVTVNLPQSFSPTFL